MYPCNKDFLWLILCGHYGMVFNSIEVALLVIKVDLDQWYAVNKYVYIEQYYFSYSLAFLINSQNKISSSINVFTVTYIADPSILVGVSLTDNSFSIIKR